MRYGRRKWCTVLLAAILLGTNSTTPEAASMPLATDLYREGRQAEKACIPLLLELPQQIVNQSHQVLWQQAIHCDNGDTTRLRSREEIIKYFARNINTIADGGVKVHKHSRGGIDLDNSQVSPFPRLG